MSKRILLCDDEIHILKASEIKFQRAGFEVRTASDGQEAVDTIATWRPDIIVTDFQMPRLDGLGLVQHIRNDAELESLPVIMLTAKGFELTHTELAEKWGVIAVFAKPFSPRELLQSVQQVIETGACTVPKAYV